MDYLSLKAAAAEADRVLSGSRITDAWQSGKKEVALVTRRGPGLVLSIDPLRPGLFLMERGQLPQRLPYPFNDLLRARVKGTTLGSVVMSEPGERVVFITFTAVWPAKKGTPLKMVLEVMGRRSNLVLLEEGRILQPLRAVTRDKSPARPVVAGEPYQPPPPRPGVPVEDVTERTLAALRSPLDAYSLLEGVRGMSPYTASQALTDALRKAPEGGPGPLRHDQAVVRAIGEMVAACTGERGFLHRSANKIHLTAFEPASVARSDLVESFSPFSKAAVVWREAHDSGASKDDSEETRLERGLRDRLERIDSTLAHVDAEEERCLAHDELRVMAEALLIHAEKVPAGSQTVTLPDPYDEVIEITVPLDPAKGPRENAKTLFNSARRLKRGLEEVHRRRGLLEGERKEVRRALEALLDRNDPEPARKLIEGAAARPAVEGKTRQAAYGGPGRRHTVDGFTILVGKSSTDNEKVTFGAAGPHDLWLHARDYPGSHVVILTGKRRVPDNVLYEAAGLAAAGSGAKNDTAPEIMVTERKWVRKLKGGKPGQVTVERYRTIRPRSQKKR